PKSIVVRSVRDLKAAINEIGYPVVIKPVQSWGDTGGIGTRLGAESATRIDEAVHLLDKILAAGLDGVVQEWLPGRRDAVSFFFTSGRVWARFAQTSYREFPAVGGSSVL